jgi:hypothetical protein
MVVSRHWVAVRKPTFSFAPLSAAQPPFAASPKRTSQQLSSWVSVAPLPDLISASPEWPLDIRQQLFVVGLGRDMRPPPPRPSAAASAFVSVLIVLTPVAETVR